MSDTTQETDQQRVQRLEAESERFSELSRRQFNFLHEHGPDHDEELAKEVRERRMSRLKKKYGKDMGSGYSSDPVTRKFLDKNIKKHSESGIFRKSWKTWKKASSKSKQKKLEF